MGWEAHMACMHQHCTTPIHITALEKRKSMGDAGVIWREQRKKERKREVARPAPTLLSRTTQHADAVRISTNQCGYSACVS